MNDFWNAMRVAIPLGLATLAALVLAGEFEPDAAIFAVAATLVALLIAAVPLEGWRKAGARVEKAEAFGMSIGLSQAATDAASGTLPEEPYEEKDEASGAELDEWTRLRLKLEAKLAYIAKTMRPGEEKQDAPRPQTFVTVGSLHHDGYLSDAEAQTATAVLSPALIPPGERAVVLKQGATVVGRIRASIFFEMVRNRLEDLCDSVREEPRGEGQRPDLAGTKGGREFRVSSAFATTSNSNILAGVVKRAKKARGSGDGEPWIVVVPDNSSATTDESADDIRVVKLSRLQHALPSEPS